MVVLAIKIISLFKVASSFPLTYFLFIFKIRANQHWYYGKTFTTLLGITVDTLAGRTTRISGWGL